MTLTTKPDHDDIDISTLAFWSLSAEERDKRLAFMRRERPVSWQRPAVGLATFPGRADPGYWAVVRHADVVTVSRHPEIYCSSRGVAFEDVPEEILEASSSFLATDHPRHTELRRLVSAAFTPRRVQALEERIASRARQLVDQLIDEGEGDFVETVAKPLPASVFAEMMGVPEEDRDRVAGLANDMVIWNDPDALGDRDGFTLLLDTIVGLYGVSNELSRQRRAEPADDLLSGLVTAEVDGQRLTDEEIAAFFVLLSVAANDTTRQTISHGIRALCRFRDQRALLASDLDGYLPGAVEEMVRWATPVMTFRRTATQDTELGGQAIEAGDKVVMFYVSANRDERVFTDPWTFDITREPNHLGFGGGGPHFCLGAALGRTMLRVMVRELVTRCPQLEVGEPKFLVANFIQGITSMPYRLG